MVLDKLLYDKKEAGRILGGVSEHTINRDIHRGLIQVRKYGRRVLIPRDEILRIAQEGMQPAHASQ